MPAPVSTTIRRASRTAAFAWPRGSEGPGIRRGLPRLASNGLTNRVEMHEIHRHVAAEAEPRGGTRRRTNGGLAGAARLPGRRDARRAVGRPGGRHARLRPAVRLRRAVLARRDRTEHDMADASTRGGPRPIAGGVHPRSRRHRAITRHRRSRRHVGRPQLSLRPHARATPASSGWRNRTARGSRCAAGSHRSTLDSSTGCRRACRRCTPHGRCRRGRHPMPPLAGHATSLSR